MDTYKAVQQAMPIVLQQLFVHKPILDTEHKDGDMEPSPDSVEGQTSSPVSPYIKDDEAKVSDVRLCGHPS